MHVIRHNPLSVQDESFTLNNRSVKLFEDLTNIAGQDIAAMFLPTIQNGNLRYIPTLLH